MQIFHLSSSFFWGPAAALQTPPRCLVIEVFTTHGLHVRSIYAAPVFLVFGYNSPAIYLKISLTWF